MKKLTLILLMFCAFITKAQPNLILNVSFEQNSLTQCHNEMNSFAYNNSIDYSTSYGSSITFIEDSCLFCNAPTYWGGEHKRGIGLLVWRLKYFTTNRELYG